MSTDYTPQLRSLMQRANLTSFRQLGQAAKVSSWQIEQLRRGKAAEMRLAVLHRLGQALHLSLQELLGQFSDLDVADSSPAPLLPTAAVEEPIDARSRALETQFNQLQQEYQRLQTQLDQQRQALQQEFQQASLQILESWLLQFPTAAYAAQQNPQAPAVKLLPLMRPIEQLLRTWGIEPIATVGAELPYDPQHHQLMDGGAQPGDRVRVRYVGYRQSGKLLYRAKVSPVAGSAR
jgi:molecular chaperone GrpE (heat shock protein)/DNA-binding Xre family transcriptional regulator